MKDEEKYQFISVRMSRTLATQTRALAALRGLSRSELLRRALKRELQTAGLIKVTKPQARQNEQ